MPICIVVEAVIEENRMEEFLEMIEKNAIGSRSEPGCIRFGMCIVKFLFLTAAEDIRFFNNYSVLLPWLLSWVDVLQVEDAPNKFIFYEIYQTADDISFHKEQSHYLAWVAFKESGGTISSVSKKAMGKFLSWIPMRAMEWVTTPPLGSY